MSVRADTVARAPRRVSLLNRLVKPLLAAGIPFLFNGLITIRGRTSGLPRTTPVAIIPIGNRRFVWAPWGDVHWVRNLRAAGRATIAIRRRTEEVSATELNEAERVVYFRDLYGPLARSIPGGFALVRLVDGVDLRDPVAAAEGRRVFELHPIDEVAAAAAQPRDGDAVA